MLQATRIERQTTGQALLVQGRRLLALAASAALLAGAFVAVSPVLPDTWVPWRAETTLPAAALPDRPAAVPAQIPGWAWSLHAWHSAPPADRGARPAAAPRQVPAWYWEWRAWRLAVSG